MKILKNITLVILVLTLIGTVLLLGGLGFVVLFVVIPYIILLILWYRNTNIEAPSTYSLFIVSIIVCPITFLTYREITKYPGSSTAGIEFVFLPIFSIIFITVAYSFLNWAAAKVLAANKYIRIMAAIAGAVVIAGLLYTTIPGPDAYKNTKNFHKRKLTKNINDAKKKGVFVKELHYKVNGFENLPELKPYLEKGFKYGEDSTHFVPFVNTNFPYRLGFNRRPVKDVLIYVRNEEIIKFDSANGSGYHGASGFLTSPKLRDTITLGIRKNNALLGTVKVWD